MVTPESEDDCCVTGACVESVCRTGCKTQDHASYKDCLADARIQIGNLK